jgi:NRPS condensation-like uncharacterized protein
MSLLKSGRPSAKVKIDKVETMKMNINIDKSFHKEIKRYALEHDITVTDLILTSLRKYIKKQL